MDEQDILTRAWQENLASMRQMDAQRTTLSNIIFVIAAAATGLLIKHDTTSVGWQAALALLIIGVFGIIAVLKLYERHQLYKTRAEACLQEVSQGTFDLLKDTETVHEKEHKFLSGQKLYELWVMLHVLIALVGACVLVRILFF